MNVQRRTGRERAVVATLAVTVTASYGVLMYAFPVVLTAMQQELGWSSATLTGAYAAGALTGGIAAVPLGARLDRRDARAVFILCAIGASLLVAAWSRVQTVAGLYAVWLALGVCSAGLFYDAAFTAVAGWPARRRTSAMTSITVAGGLASTLFVPITAALTERFGWRNAVLLLAGLLALLTVVPLAAMRIGRGGNRRRKPAAAISITMSARAGGTRVALRSPALRRIGAAFAIATVASAGLAIHLVPLLLERGQDLAMASAALATLGLAKPVGRIALQPLSTRVPLATAAIGLLAMQAAGLLVLVVAPGPVGPWLAVALFGIGDGATTPARAGLIAELRGPVGFGAAAGVVALGMAAARAVGPVGVSIVHTFGGYVPALLLLTTMLLAACHMLASTGLCRAPACCVLFKRPSSACMEEETNFNGSVL